MKNTDFYWRNEDNNMKKIVCLASGRGSNFKALINGIKNEKVDAVIQALVTEKEGDVGAVITAKENNIPIVKIPFSKSDPKKFDNIFERFIDKVKPDYILLLGFMKILSKHIVTKYEGRIINIHPSLLPAFKGLEAQKQAFNYGVKISGCTMHYANENVDSGNIISQKAVNISGCKNWLEAADKILEAEHKLLVETMAYLCN